MRKFSLLALTAAAMVAQPAAAATFNLSLTADAGSRWYEYYSAVYAELGSDWGTITAGADQGEQGDGFYLVSNGAKVGSGAVVFPNAGNFINIGSISYDAGTGAITGLTLDFDNYVADNDALGFGYTTTTSNVSGTVSLSGGLVTGVQLQSNIAFTYFGSVSYDGLFSITGNRFDLAVDETNVVPLGGQPRSIRLAWDVQGGVQNLAPVPEPTTYALMLGGLGVLAMAARRRRDRAAAL